MGLSALCPVCRHLCGALVHGHVYMSVSDGPRQHRVQIIALQGGRTRACLCVCVYPLGHQTACHVGDHTCVSDQARAAGHILRQHVTWAFVHSL